MSKLDAKQCAEMFLRSMRGPHDAGDALRLMLLLNEFGMAGHELALDKAQSIYRTLHSGGCRIMSENDDCNCFLCQTDRAKLRGPSTYSPPEPPLRF